MGVGAIAGLTACGHPVQNKLEGRWVGDSVENFDDGHVAIATGWAKGASFEFSGATITIDGARDNWFGSWPPGVYGEGGEPPAEERRPKSG